MINTGKRMRGIGMLIILSVVLALAIALLWVFLLDADTQQDKNYSGAKLVEQQKLYIKDLSIL